MARTLDTHTAKLSSDTFLAVRLGAVATALVLQSLGTQVASLLVGPGAPTVLSLGCDTKRV